MKKRHVLYPLALVLLSGSLLEAQQVTFLDETFAVVGGSPLRFDLTLPGLIDPEAPWPVAIYIHGGGWQTGNYKRPPVLKNRLLAEGIAVASVSYRLTTQEDAFGGESVVYPAQIHDVKGSIRFLRANAADYGIDPERIAVYGTSAGAHLAAVAALGWNESRIEGTIGGNVDQSSAVVGFVAISAPTDLLNSQPDFTDPPGSTINHDDPTSGESMLIGFSDPGEGLGVLRENLDNPEAPFPELKLRVELASPAKLADPQDPPGLIIHGTEDTTVAVYQAQRLADSMAANDLQYTLIIGEGLGHVQLTPAINSEIISFMKELFTVEASGDRWVVF